MDFGHIQNKTLSLKLTMLWLFEKSDFEKKYYTQNRWLLSFYKFLFKTFIATQKSIITR